MSNILVLRLNWGFQKIVPFYFGTENESEFLSVSEWSDQLGRKEKRSTVAKRREGTRRARKGPPFVHSLSSFPAKKVSNGTERSRRRRVQTRIQHPRERRQKRRRREGCLNRPRKRPVPSRCGAGQLRVALRRRSRRQARRLRLRCDTGSGGTPVSWESILSRVGIFYWTAGRSSFVFWTLCLCDKDSLAMSSKGSNMNRRGEFLCNIKKTFNVSRS